MLDDGVFAAAYDSLDPGRRAWLKKNSAEVHCIMEPAKKAFCRYSVSWTMGFGSQVAVKPYGTALFFIGGGVSSPAQVAAAALPLMFSGVREVAAVRVGPGGKDPDDILAALELCGVEQVYALGEGDASECLTSALADPGCACFLLGCGEMEFARPDHVRAFVWERPEVREFAVLPGPGGCFDYEVMAWAHPGSRFIVFGGEQADLPENFSRVEGGLEAMLAIRPDVAFACPPVPEESLLEIPLVLGPGQEGCFFWPELLDRRIAKTSLHVLDEDEPGSEDGDLLI